MSKESCQGWCPLRSTQFPICAAVTVAIDPYLAWQPRAKLGNYLKLPSMDMEGQDARSADRILAAYRDRAQPLHEGLERLFLQRVAENNCVAGSS